MKKHLFVIGGLLLLASLVTAQTSITDMEVTYNQNFNTLAADTGSKTFTDNVTLPGWYSNRYTYRADSGSSNAGGLKSYGESSASSDRALGSIGSSSAARVIYAWRFSNNTGDIIRSVLVSFTGEQWRLAPKRSIYLPDKDTILFQYQVDAATCSTGTWTNVPQLLFAGPLATVDSSSYYGPLNGNADSCRIAISYRFDVTVNDGQEIWIAFRDTNDLGNDNGVAVDDVNVTAYNTVGVAGSPIAAPGTAFWLRPAQPSPASSATAIRYSLPRSAKVSLSVLNMLGQHVATLASGVQTAGEHQVRWSLRNDAGAPAPNGIYFIRLESGSLKDTRKMIVVR